MSGIIIGFFTILLILVSIFLILIVLMQRASANSGMGSALGGGAAESALGGEAGNILTKLTVKGTVIFFVVAFGLYLGQLASYDNAERSGIVVPVIEPDSEEAEPVESGLTDISDAVNKDTSLGIETVPDTAASGSPEENILPEIDSFPDTASATADTETGSVPVETTAPTEGSEIPSPAAN